MWEVMTACVIMHNMIVENERDDSRLFDQGWEFEGELVEPTPGPATHDQYSDVYAEMRDKPLHERLQNDLIEHMWIHLGNQKCFLLIFLLCYVL